MPSKYDLSESRAHHTDNEKFNNGVKSLPETPEVDTKDEKGTQQPMVGIGEVVSTDYALWHH